MGFLSVIIQYRIIARLQSSDWKEQIVFSRLRAYKVMHRSGEIQLIVFQILNHVWKNGTTIAFNGQILKAWNRPFCPPFRS